MEKKIKSILKTIKLNESVLSMAFGVVTIVLIGILAFRMYQTAKPTITQEADSTTEEVAEGSIVLPSSYTVVQGDNLWKIAEKAYGSGYNWVDIAKENQLKNASKIEVGQELKIPKVEARVATKIESPKTVAIEGDTYTIVKGDNLWSVSVRAYADGYKWVEVARANNLTNPGYIEIGQVIKLPR